MAEARQLRFPWERALVMAVAAVVGLYAGIAAGLFAAAIRFVQLILFRGREVAGALFTRDSGWSQVFRARAGESRWHLEFAALALLLLAAAAALQALGRVKVPLFEARRLRAVALAGALGLALYYPLLLLRVFNATFQEREGGLYALLLAAPRWLWLACPALGAFLAALLVRYVSPESGGHGVVEVIEAVHLRDKPLKGRVALWKSLAAGLVIGSGGSAGREGPVVHLGGAVASSLGRFLELPRREISLLLACGAGAGIAASFQAPLAGSLFALEIVLGDFHVARFTPIVLACVTATATSRALLSGGSELRPVAWSLNHPSEIGVYVVLGLLAGLCGVLYGRLIHAGELLFAGKLRFGARLGTLRPELKAGLGGLGVGLLALIAPRVEGTGIETMNAALAGQLAMGALFVALICKLLATACTLGSGSPGGSFFPAVFVGAMLGGAFGHLVQVLLPGIASGADAYAAVGMGAVVAGATVAPLTGVLMMFELTGSYQIVLPLLVACGIAAAVVNGVQGGSIYTLAARRRGVRLSRGGPSLGDLSVAQALDRAPTVQATASLTALAALLQDGVTGHEAAAAAFAAFPVLDGERVLGLASARDLRSALLAGDPAVTAAQLVKAAPQLLPDDDLDAASRELTSAGADAGLVLSGGTVLGIVTQQGILAAWRRATDVHS